MSTNFDTESEDELPPGWEEKLTESGRIYYVDHIRRVTQWQHPKTGLTKKLSQELPYGWTKSVCRLTGKDIFYNSKNNLTSEIDPRRAFPVYEGEISASGRNGRVWQRFDGSSTADQVVQGRDLTGFHVIITGANSGIGFETAKSLAGVGAIVVLGCRNMKKASKAMDSIRKEHPSACLHAIAIDLCCLSTVERFVQNYKLTYNKLHLLVLNAGTFWHRFEKTADRFETTFQTNYLGHFYLVRRLKDLLFCSAPSRIVIVSAESHRLTDLKCDTICEGLLSPQTPELYHPILAYNLSKMCLMMLATELHLRWFKHGVLCFAVHPGNMVYTNLCRNHILWRFLFFLVSPFSKTAQQGAACSVYCGTARELEQLGGKYFVNCFEVEPSPESLNRETCSMLWMISRSMVSKSATLKEDFIMGCKSESCLIPMHDTN